MKYKLYEFLEQCKISCRYELTTLLIELASCFRAFPIFWNGASARDDISLRTWSGGTTQLRT